MSRGAVTHVVSAFALMAAAQPARADDWLAAMPECAHGAEARALGRMALLYPRPGLPAVVAAGDRLVTRVRVSSGLTPPPGVQQDRALRDWSAVLLGYATPLGSPVEHRIPLRVYDVRPDAASSLVYRATVRVPLWTAPGTYALRLFAPGGRDVAGSAVRVVAAGSPIRVAMLGELGDDEDRESGARGTGETLRVLARLPVDVWIARESPALLAVLRAAPLPPRSGGGGEELPVVLAVPAAGLAAVVRYGDEALALGRCDSPHLRFADLLGHLRRDGARLRTLSSSDLPGPGRYAPPGRAERALPVHADVSIAREDGGLAVAVPGALGAPAELTVVVPGDGRATRVTGARGAWWPATPVGASEAVPALALRLAVAAGGRARVSRTRGRPLQLAISPERVRTPTGIPVAFHAQPSRRAERVAWTLGEERSALGARTEAPFLPLGIHRVSALAITPDGVPATATARVEVITREGTGMTCGIGGPGPGGPLELLPVLLWLVQRTRRRRRE